MNQYELNVDDQEKRQLHKIRISYLAQAKHTNDYFINLGYNYTGRLFKNGTSSELWANPQQINLYSRLEGMLTYILEESKMIKKWFSIAHDKKTIRVS